MVSRACRSRSRGLRGVWALTYEPGLVAALAGHEGYVALWERDPFTGSGRGHLRAQGASPVICDVPPSSLQAQVAVSQRNILEGKVPEESSKALLFALTCCSACPRTPRSPELGPSPVPPSSLPREGWNDFSPPPPPTPNLTYWEFQGWKGQKTPRQQTGGSLTLDLPCSPCSPHPPPKPPETVARPPPGGWGLLQLADFEPQVWPHKSPRAGSCSVWKSQ